MILLSAQDLCWLTLEPMMNEKFSLLLEHHGGISNSFCNVVKKNIPEFLELFVTKMALGMC